MDLEQIRKFVSDTIEFSVGNSLLFQKIVQIMERILEKSSELKFRKLKKKSKIMNTILTTAEGHGGKVLQFAGFLHHKKRMYLPVDADLERFGAHIAFLKRIGEEEDDKELRTSEDVTLKWQGYLKFGDSVSCVANLARFYHLKAMEVVKRGIESGLVESRGHLLLCHIYDTLGLVARRHHDITLSVEYFQLAVNEIEGAVEKDEVKDDESSNRIVFSAYANLAECLVLLSNNKNTQVVKGEEGGEGEKKVADTEAVDKLFDIAWKYACKLTPGDKRRVAQMSAGWNLRLGRVEKSREYMGMVKETLTENESEVTQRGYDNVRVLMDIERVINKENAKKQVARLGDLLERNLKDNPQFSACMYGQILFHYSRFASPKELCEDVEKLLVLEDSEEIAKKAFGLIRTLKLESHVICSKICHSMQVIYGKLENKEKATEFGARMEEIMKRHSVK